MVFMMQGLCTREKYVTDFALGIRHTYSFEEYFMLWPLFYTVASKNNIKTALLDCLFFFSFSIFLTIPWAFHLGIYLVFADLILLRYYIWKYVIIKHSCFNQRTQTYARSIYQRKLKWSYESLANFSFENFVNRSIMLEILIFQIDFEEPFNLKVEKLKF